MGATAAIVMMVTAAMGAAAAIVVVMLAVMIALDMGVKVQLSCQKRFHCRVSIAGDTAVQLNISRRQGHLSAAADSAADQNIGVQGVQHAGQSAVAAAVGIHHFGGNDLALCYVIDLELLRVAKVLENFTVIISYRDSHKDSSFQR